MRSGMEDRTPQYEIIQKFMTLPHIHPINGSNAIIQNTKCENFRNRFFLANISMFIMLLQLKNNQ